MLSLIFSPGLDGTARPNCSSSTASCAKIDIEQFATDGDDYSPNVAQDISYLAMLGGSGSNTMKVYVNSADAYLSILSGCDNERPDTSAYWLWW